MSKTTVRAMVHRGELQAIKQPGAPSRPWKVDRAALEAFSEAQRGSTRQFVKDNPPGFASMWDRETGLTPR